MGKVAKILQIPARSRHYLIWTFWSGLNNSMEQIETSDDEGLILEGLKMVYRWKWQHYFKRRWLIDLKRDTYGIMRVYDKFIR